MATEMVTGQRVKDQKFLFLGAGEAGLGVANLLVLLLRDMGVNPVDAYKKIWLYDGKCSFGADFGEITLSVEIERVMEHS